MPKSVQQIIGNVGGDPEDGETKVGDVTRFSVAVTKAYPDAGEDNGVTRWVQVAVFKESIREQVHAKISKGTRVAVEGTITESSYQGKKQYGMKASRVGLVDWFLPSAEDKKKAEKQFGKSQSKAKAASSDDDDDWG
jgi:single stranded DNA-binding protein